MSLSPPPILPRPYKATDRQPWTVALEFLSAGFRDAMDGHTRRCPLRGSQMASVATINHTFLMISSSRKPHKPKLSTTKDI